MSASYRRLRDARDEAEARALRYRDELLDVLSLARLHWESCKCLLCRTAHAHGVVYREALDRKAEAAEACSMTAPAYGLDVTDVYHAIAGIQDRTPRVPLILGRCGYPFELRDRRTLRTAEQRPEKGAICRACLVVEARRV